MNGGLLRLWLRRALPAPLVVSFLLLLLLAATRGWTPEAASTLDPDHAARRADDFRRQAVWLVFALVALPALLVRAAELGHLWRRGDADWLAWRPISRLHLLAHGWLGLTVAAGVLTGLTLLAAEGASHSSRQAMRYDRAVAHEATVLRPDQERASITLASLSGPSGTGLATGERVRVELTVAPGSGPVANLRISLGEAHETAAVYGRRTFELATTGTVEALLIERVGPGAIVVLPPESIHVVAPAASARLGSFELALRMLLALAAWTALALALGAWMRAGLAACLCACLALATVRWLEALAFLPGSDLVRAWRLLGDGLLPAPVPVPGFLGMGALVILSLFVARRGLARGRSLPRW